MLQTDSPAFVYTCVVAIVSDISTGYEPFIQLLPSNGEHSIMIAIHSSQEGIDMSDVAVLEMSGKQFIRRQSRDGKARSSSRTTPSIAAHARVAPKSVPVIIHVPAASQTALAGIRKTSPTSGSLDPSIFREKRRKSVEINTQWIHPSPVKTPTAREGHSSPPEGDRSSSSNIRSVREGNSSHRLSAPLWSGTSQSLPDASQMQMQTLRVNTAREGFLTNIT